MQRDIQTVKEKKYAWMSQIVSECWKQGKWDFVVLHDVVKSWKRDIHDPFLILYLSSIYIKIKDTMTSKERKIYPEEMKYYIGCLLTDLLGFAEKSKK